MALNPTVLKTRTLTAAVFVIVMLAGLLWSRWSFFLLFSIVHFGCWIEYQRIVALIDKGYAEISPFHRYGVMIAGWCGMLYFTNDALSIGGLSLRALGYWGGLAFLFILPIGEILLSRKLNAKNIFHSAFGLVYISLSLGLLTHIRCLFFGGYDLQISKMLVLMIIGSIWINDTMAYIVGSLIGRTPLTKISPKKTWEGTLGGIALAIIVMGVIGYLLKGKFDWDPVPQWMIIAGIASVAGTFGDLLESKLKRLAGVKDSGQIMPGHGGFLDRFDSLLIATPFVWLYVWWMVQ